jgi:hypothetical protein
LKVRLKVRRDIVGSLRCPQYAANQAKKFRKHLVQKRGALQSNTKKTVRRMTSGLRPMAL